VVEQDLNQIITHLFRREAGKMAAVLTRLFGWQRLDLAEDIVQDTLLKAMSTWKFKGVPENPSAWLYKVAKRKAIDALRQQHIHEGHHSQIKEALRSEWTLTPAVQQFFFENEIEDSQLRMMFACCHPAIPYESQIALTLKTLCGLSVQEIAHSFLTNEDTITKRLYRAKEKIREEKISMEAPIPARLPGRMDAVLHTLYLLFNEGYNSSHPSQLIRHDLCEEAMRLCVLLTRNTITRSGKVSALLALMCFQASREDARINPDGTIRLLKDQDRGRWDKRLIEKGRYYLEQSADDDGVSAYHIEAAIAGSHSAVDSFPETDWVRIAKLYAALEEINPSPVVQLNKAIAIGYAESATAGLYALDAISTLQEHHLYHAAKGDFFADLNKVSEARNSYLRAMALTSSNAEKDLLQSKLTALVSADHRPTQ
jgi:RNA polymerase sigma-70 factor (ECF subfamily)